MYNYQVRHRQRFCENYILLITDVYKRQHPRHLPPWLFLRAHRVNPGRTDTGMPQQIHQPHHVFLDAVKNSCKQVAEIMGKYLRRIHPGLSSKLLHPLIDIASVHQLPVPCDENASASDSHFPAVLLQHSHQFHWQQRNPGFPLVINIRPCLLYTSRCV